MADLEHQNQSSTPKTSAPTTSYTPPEWEPTQPQSTGHPGLTDAQLAQDEAAAAEAGMGSAEVSVLGSFGLRPSEMDPTAAERMSTALKRAQALLACEAGNEVACELTGPGMVGHQSWEGVSGDSAEDLVVEDADFTLRISTRTAPDGTTERVLLYEDADGNFYSGMTTEALEGTAQPAPKQQQPVEAPDKEGFRSFFEGALLGDFAGNDSWSAVAGQSVVGLIPIVGQIADARDTLAAIKDVADGKDGAWGRLLGAGVGWIPGVGDALKGSMRLGMRAGAEVVEEGAERVVKEVAEEVAEEGSERAVKEGAEEGVEETAQAASKVKPTTPSLEPDPNAMPRGSKTKLNPNDKDPDNIRALTRENESADTLAKNGYDIEQNPTVEGPKNPDYRIEGKIFDNYAPSRDKPRSIWDTVVEKVTDEQASRIVLNLDDSKVSIEALRAQFAAWPVEGLQEIIVVRGGQVIPFFP